MAIAVVTGNNFLTANAFGNVSKQFVNNISTGGSLLVAFVSINTASAKTLSCSDDINGSWTSLPYVLNSGLITQVQIFYKHNSAAGGKPTVSITGLAAEQSVLTIAEFTGVMHTSDPLDVFNSNSVSGGSGFPTSGTLTTTTNGLVVGYAEMYPTATPSVGAGFTLGALVSHSSGYPGGIEYNVSATTGSNDAVWGNSAQSYWAGVGAAFKAALPISSSGVFTRKVVRNSQPQINTPIDYSNPINVGLQSFISFNRREINSIGRTQLSRVGTGLTPNQTTMGMGISSNGGTNYFTAATGTKLVCADTKFSVLLTIKLNATGQTNTYAVFERASSGTGTQSAVIYGYTSNQFEFYSPGFSGSDPRTGSGITVSDLLPHTILYTYDGTLWSGYLDGVCVFSVARSFTVPLNDSTGIAAILNAAGSHQLNATIINYATWSVGLQPSAAVEVSMNPWQLFAPIKKYLPTYVSQNSIYRKLKYHNRQPQYLPVLDYSNSLTKDLIFHAPLHPTWGMRDLVSGKTGTKTGLATSHDTNYGKLPLFDTSNYVDFTVPPTFDGNLPTTFAWVQKPVSVSGYTTVLDIRAAVNAGSNDFLIYESSSDTNYYLAIGNRNGGSNAANFYTTVGPVTNGKLDYFVATLTNGINDASGTLSHYAVWRNGVKLNAAASTTIFGAATQTGFRIGDLLSSGNPFKGALGGVSIWQRVLTDKEAYLMTTNPAAIYAPSRRYYPTAPTGNTTTTQTIAGQSRIQATTTKTETGKARIQVTTTKTETGVSRISIVTTKTETGLSRIQKVVNQTISGVANIATSTITTIKTITGTGRVQKTVTQTESGVSRIQLVTTKTETGLSRIQKVVNQTITGVANIASSTVTTTKTISGVSRITATTTRTETGTGRIQKTVTQTETGQARISITTTKTETGKSRVQTVVNQTETGKARITAISSQAITGKAKILSASAGAVTIPLKTYYIELGAGISKSLTPTGNMIEVEIVISAPVDPPTNGKGVVFMISGGVVTIYVWSGSAWIAK